MNGLSVARLGACTNRRSVCLSSHSVHGFAGNTWRLLNHARPTPPGFAVFALINTTFAQEIADDVLAFVDVPKEHRARIRSTNMFERLDGDLKRRADVVGIFPNENAITRLVGAVLLEQNDEYAIQERYMGLESLATMSENPAIRLPAAPVHDRGNQAETLSIRASLLHHSTGRNPDEPSEAGAMTRGKHLASAVMGALVATAAHDQNLDFDAACPVLGTCPVGSRFAAVGVSFSPGIDLVVPPNSGLLTGPVGGGKFLYILSQSAIALSRPATTVTLQLSRANLSANPLTVTLNFVRNGAIVDSTFVVLEVVNQWTAIDLYVQGGFDTLVLAPSGASGDLAFGIDGLLFGGRCNGFSDVLPGDIFCNATEWLANRGVTFGCAAGQYCPTQGVTRSQMALFMNRLADALTPVTLYRYDSETGDLSGAERYDVCATNVLPAASWPRQASISIALVLRPSMVSTWRTTPTIKPDDRSWDFAVGGGPVNVVSFEPNRYGTLHFVVEGVPIFANRTYRFGAFLDRFQGSGDAGAISCRVSVRVENGKWNVPYPPFDSAASNGGDSVTTVH